MSADGETPYTETEALLLAMDDLEADSGNHKPLDRYIVENFLPGERRRLASAARLLEERAWAIRDSIREELDD